MEQLNTQTETPQSNSSNILIYSLIGVVVILLIYIGYIYNTKELVKKQEMKKEYIKKADITYDDLPLKIQDKYLLQSLYDYKVAELETKIDKLSKKTVEKLAVKEKTTEPLVVEKVKEVEKIVEVEKVVEKLVEVVRSEVVTNKEVVETYTCKTLPSSSEYVTKKCKKELKIFLNKNKDAKRFEVIGLVDNREFVLLNNLEDVYGKKRLGNLPQYAQSGLSRKRVIEASWIVRQHLGKGRTIDAVNYTITKKNKRGFVVKAYK